MNEFSFQYKVWKLITNNLFDTIILTLICLNTITLMIKHFEMSPDFEALLATSNVIFTTLFSIECFLKLYGFGPLNYFRDSWNVFDYVTVIGSLADVLLAYILATNEDVEINLSFLRLFRAARLLKLLRQFESIRILLWTFVQSIKVGSCEIEFRLVHI